MKPRIVCRISKGELYDMPVQQLVERLQWLQEQYGTELTFDWKHDDYDREPNLVVMFTAPVN